MDLGLTGRRALVLGASRGLGAAVARVLATEGATVIAAARAVDVTGAWCAQLAPEVAARVRPVPFDLSDRMQVDRLAADAGAIDIVINNSGGPPAGLASTSTPEQWMEQFQTMAAHLFHLNALLLPAMLARGWGRIVTIASSGIEQPIPNLALSNGIRSAVLGWSKTLSAEVAARGVTVNVMVPGRIHTDRVDQLNGVAARAQGRSVDDVSRDSIASIPAGRYGRPEEFADAVAFVASDRASYMTGAVIRVDGGMVRSV